MAIKYVFNPFTGNFDVIDEATAGAGQDVSDPGQFTVLASVNPGILVYSNGSLSAAPADNGSVATTPAIGIVLAKPTSTTATIQFSGKISIFAGLTVGADYFMGTAGAIIQAASLPSAAGSVIQKVGIAVSSTTLILNPQLPVII